ncbi:hypothetical protein ACYX8G_08320 [Microbacterium saperdae]
MSDDSATPHDPETPPDPAVAPSPADSPLSIPEPVIPPPPPEIPIPDGLIPPASSDVPDAVIPPPPLDIAPADSVIPPPPPEAMVPSRRSARPAGTSDAPAPAAVSEEWSQPTMTPEVPSGGYRGLTAAIFVFLLILFAGAIALVIYLATSTRLELPSFGQEAPVSAPSGASATEEEASTVSVGSLTTDPCSDFCAEIAGQVGPSVIGADGATEWQLVQPWTVADPAALPAEEATAASYESEVGSLTFTVWKFTDDATAEAAYAVADEGLGDPSDTNSVYEDGRGTQNTYQDDSSTTVLWIVTGDGSQPWVLQVQGDDDAVRQFYLSLPI